MTDPTVQIGLDTPDKVAIAGDWHGNGSWAYNAITYASRKGADTIIHVGDFGHWVPGEATEEYLDTVEEACQDNLVRLYWIDGNHEYHPHRETGGFNDPAQRPLTTYLPRGTRWRWWGKNFMAVGGAFSIDRYLRTEGRSWWPGELLTPEDVAHACAEPHDLDVIITHDCPTGVNIPGIGPDSKPRGGADSWPPNMLAGARAHRLKMREIWDTHHPQRWYYGHYHVPSEIWYGPTRFIGLDCDGCRGGYENNIAFLTQADLK